MESALFLMTLPKFLDAAMPELFACIISFIAEASMNWYFHYSQLKELLLKNVNVLGYKERRVADICLST